MEKEIGSCYNISPPYKSIVVILLSVILLWSSIVTSQAHISAASKRERRVALWDSVTVPHGLGVEDIHSIVVMSNDDNILLLGTWQGVYRSADGGASWQETLRGWSARVIASPRDSTRIYASAGNNLFVSKDGGITWQRRSAPNICVLAAANDDKDHIYASSCQGSERSSIYVSRDGGTTWREVSSNQFTYSGVILYPDALRVSSSDPNLIFASTWGTLYRSTDGGHSWKSVKMGYAIGPVYFSKRQEWLYLPDWGGLWKSVDRGESWQASTIGRDLSTLTFPPWNPDVVWVGGNGGSWIVIDKGERWTARGIGIPGKVKQFISGREVVYSLTTAGLWRTRRVVQRGTSIQVIPAIYDVARPYSSSTDDAERAIARANKYRAIVGSLPFLIHPALIQAAQNHARYYVLNHDLPELSGLGAHSEVPNTPGFTGEGPSARAIAAGYPPDWAFVWEDMHFLSDPLRSVDDWVAAPFHRIAVLHPSLRAAGYARANDSGVQVDVLDVAPQHVPTGTWRNRPEVLVYPAPDQTDVPVGWHGAEIPSPLPPGASGPVGYPITLYGLGGKLVISSASLTDLSGKNVPVYPNSPHCSSRDCYLLIPRQPLLPFTTYEVRTQGTIGEQPFQKVWHFTTGGRSRALMEIPERSPR